MGEIVVADCAVARLALGQRAGHPTLPLDDVFARVRLRVSEVTNGGEVPWYASQITTPFFFTAQLMRRCRAGGRCARKADAQLREC